METLLAIDRIAFRIGDIEVAWYGLLITFGMIIALFIVCWHMKKIGMHTDDGVEIFLWVVPLGVVCARLLYVIVRPSEYFYHWTSFDDFVNMIAIWEGGLTIIGGIIGGIGGIIIFWFRHRKQLSLGMCLDTAVVPVLLAQAIGRVGNFINQEAFGIAITKASMQHFPIAIYITDPSGVAPEYYDQVWGYINANNGGYWFAATFFYELVWNLIGAVMFTIVLKKNKKAAGILAFCYIAWECIIRALNEYIRVDAVPITQVLCWTMLPITIVVGAIFLFYRLTKVSYNKMKFATEAGTISKIKVTKFDVWSYTFVGKLVNSDKGYAKFFEKIYKLSSDKIYDMEVYMPYSKVDK